MIADTRLLPSYAGGWAQEPDDVIPELREVRRRALGLWVPCLGPTGGRIIDLSSRQDHAIVNGTLTDEVRKYGWERYKASTSTINRADTTLRTDDFLCDDNTLLAAGVPRRGSARSGCVRGWRRVPLVAT